MPVLQQIPINSYLASGSGTVFPYTFKLPNEESLKVFIDEVLQPSGYVISNVGNNAGGNVTFTVPPPADAVIRLERSIALERNTDYIEGGDLAAAVLDSDFDTLVMMVQELDATTLRAQGGSGTDAFGRRITNVGEPVDDSDAATKGWVESSETSAVALALGHANDAEASALAAAASALNASESEEVTAADVVATTAAKVLAEGYADAADASADAAAISETNAAAWAAAASGSASAAASSASAALASENAAEAAEIGADSAEGAASAAAIAAAGSAASAAISYGNVVSTIANFPGRNKIINGKLDIAQRGSSFGAVTSGQYTLDRWVHFKTGAAVGSVAQSTGVPSSEFQSSLLYDCTTADASVAAGDFVFLRQNLEGYNARDLIGRTFTLSFWVRSRKTGIHCVALGNSVADRTYVAEYTVNVSNTWEFKTITVTGGLITAGTWNWTTGLGLTVTFTLMAGSTFFTTANAWQTGNYLSTSNQVNCVDSVAESFRITGVQLEVGAVASPFEHRSYQQELAMCQRYFYAVSMFVPGSAGYTVTCPRKVSMRVAPTYSGGGAGFATTGNSAESAVIGQTGGAVQALQLNSEL